MNLDRFEKYLTRKNLAILLGLYLLKKILFVIFMIWVGDYFDIDIGLTLLSSFVILLVMALIFKLPKPRKDKND